MHVREMANFVRQQAWVYAVFQKNVQTPEGKRYVREHRGDFNAQAVWVKLEEYSQRSAYATLDNARIMEKLTTTKLDGSH